MGLFSLDYVPFLLRDVMKKSKLEAWQLELKSALKSHDEIESFFDHIFPKTIFKNLIPLKFAESIKALGPHSPLWKMYLPHENENERTGLLNPIGDKDHSIGNGLIHRYTNRALFTPITVCPIQCRFCFRKNELHNETDLYRIDLNAISTYLNEHEEIEEIIFTGGDPFILSDSKIKEYLEFFKGHGIKYIRFHTKTPIHLPSRITDQFLQTLSKYKDSFQSFKIILHINHFEELTPNTILAINQLSSFDLLAQSVLLKDVNDSTEKLKTLINRLIQLEVRPYYLHHPDQVRGGMHFYLSPEKGQKIYKELRKVVPGWALPQYVLDSPEGKSNL